MDRPQYSILDYEDSEQPQLIIENGNIYILNEKGEQFAFWDSESILKNPKNAYFIAKAVELTYKKGYRKAEEFINQYRSLDS